MNQLNRALNNFLQPNKINYFQKKNKYKQKQTQINIAYKNLITKMTQKKTPSFPP